MPPLIERKGGLSYMPSLARIPRGSPLLVILFLSPSLDTLDSIMCESLLRAKGSLVSIRHRFVSRVSIHMADSAVNPDLLLLIRYGLSRCWSISNCSIRCSRLSTPSSSSSIDLHPLSGLIILLALIRSNTVNHLVSLIPNTCLCYILMTTAPLHCLG